MEYKKMWQTLNKLLLNQHGRKRPGHPMLNDCATLDAYYKNLFLTKWRLHTVQIENAQR